MHGGRRTILELSEQTSNGEMLELTYRVIFGSQICHVPCFSESSDRLSCNIFVITEDGLAHNISFDHPEVRPSGDEPMQVDQNRIDNSTIRNMDFISAATAVGRTLCIGSDTGTISCLSFQDNKEESFELKEGTIQRLWKGIKALTPSKAKQACGIVGLHSIDSYTLPSACLVSIHEDATLQVWYDGNIQL